MDRVDPRPMTTANRSGKKTILIIEDEASSIRPLGVILGEHFVLRTEKDVYALRDAIDATKSSDQRVWSFGGDTYAAIIVDKELNHPQDREPPRRGYYTEEEFKNLGLLFAKLLRARLPNLPIVFLSKNLNRHDRKDFAADPKTVVVDKGELDFERFTRTLQMLIDS